MTLEFQDKVVLITGSSSGIGQAAALEFAKLGAYLTIHGQSSERLENTKQLLVSNGVSLDRVLVVQGPLDDFEILKALIDKTIEKFGKLDVLINNAGIGNKEGVTDCRSVENFDYLMNINLKAPIFLTELAIPYLIKTKGTIINVSSIASQKTSTDPFYNISKAALDHFTKNYAAILAPQGIRVNSLNPGFTETFFFDRHEDSNEWKASINIPLGRWGTPKDMSNVLVFLASEKASYITGVILNVDGARLLAAAAPAIKTD